MPEIIPGALYWAPAYSGPHRRRKCRPIALTEPLEDGSNLPNVWRARLETKAGGEILVHARNLTPVATKR